MLPAHEMNVTGLGAGVLLGIGAKDGAEENGFVFALEALAEEELVQVPGDQVGVGPTHALEGLLRPLPVRLQGVCADAGVGFHELLAVVDGVVVVVVGESGDTIVGGPLVAAHDGLVILL